MNSSGQMKRVAPTIVADGGTRLCRKVGIVFGKRKKAVNGASRLRGLAFFEGFSDAELDRVAELADDVEIEAGELLIDQGRVGQECYVIESGQAEVFVGEDHLVTLGPGSMVGEMSLIDRRPRTATVVATTPMALLAFDTKAFQKLLSEMPKAEERVHTLLASRLKANLSDG
jgi:CRP-like cAMP-binding protein